jgi:iron complex transport system substrate-binding protein
MYLKNVCCFFVWGIRPCACGVFHENSTSYLKYFIMRACSFLPAATRMIYDMKLQHLLEGVTCECPPEALAEKYEVVGSALEGQSRSSEEIDRIFSSSKREGKNLHYVDEELLLRIQPDVIFTQDVCGVCQIDTACSSAAVAKLPKQPTLVSLTPSGLNDVFTTAITIASALGEKEKALDYLSSLHRRMDFIRDNWQRAKAIPRHVMLMEWIQPVYNCGHWIPEQIAAAGGIDMLSSPNGDSVVTPWSEILDYDPEVFVIAPCGFGVERGLQEIHLLTSRPEWKALKAVANRKVFIADSSLFTQPSASTLVEGIEVLAALFHPALFHLPLASRDKVVQVDGRPAGTGNQPCKVH